MHCRGQSTTQPKAPDRPATWVAVVPVKPLQAAKTRLRGAVPEAVHPDLVLAMARDTVAAALACRAVARVVVICDDPTVCAELTAVGALCLPDAPAAGLNAALAYGARAAQGAVTPRDRLDRDPGPDHHLAAKPPVAGGADPARADARRPNPWRADAAQAQSDPARADTARADTAHAGAAYTDTAYADTAYAVAALRAAAVAETGRPGAAAADGPDADGVDVVALTADLPAMRPQDLESALGAAEQAGRRAFVPDLEGTGTVLLAAPAGEALAPQFGPGSAAAHLRSGAVRLDGDWPSLRRDVDTAADLDAAARLGLGAHTGQVICTVA